MAFGREERDGEENESRADHEQPAEIGFDLMLEQQAGHDDRRRAEDHHPAQLPFVRRGDAAAERFAEPGAPIVQISRRK